MSEDQAFSFQSFRAANSDSHVSGLDYVHAIYHTQKLPADFSVCMAKLYWPEFRVVDDVVYVAENFDAEHYRALVSDHASPAKKQFWMNLIEVTGLFANLSFNEACIVANALVGSWNAKLSAEFGPAHAKARMVLDEDIDEVFVTLGDAD
jgi:hypothetical protein